jgi:hypothetical protein
MIYGEAAQRCQGFMGDPDAMKPQTGPRRRKLEKELSACGPIRACGSHVRQVTQVTVLFGFTFFLPWYQPGRVWYIVEASMKFQTTSPAGRPLHPLPCSAAQGVRKRLQCCSCALDQGLRQDLADAFIGGSDPVGGM